MSELMKERHEREILFSKTVKAGRRIYYFDVKKDRNDGMYISITESKRVKEGTKDVRPVLELSLIHI